MEEELRWKRCQPCWLNDWRKTYKSKRRFLFWASHVIALGTVWFEMSGIQSDMILTECLDIDQNLVNRLVAKYRKRYAKALVEGKLVKLPFPR